jgi:hypothetical protein
LLKQHGSAVTVGGAAEKRLAQATRDDRCEARARLNANSPVSRPEDPVPGDCLEESLGRERYGLGEYDLTGKASRGATTVLPALAVSDYTEARLGIAREHLRGKGVFVMRVAAGLGAAGNLKPYAARHARFSSGT